MKAVIIDDERLARNELSRLIKENTKINIIGEADSPEKGIEMVESLKPDLIFLDINMPGMDGFQLLEELSYIPEVIFVTAYDEYAIKAFEFNALDYLLKPVEPARLVAAVDKLEKELKQRNDRNKEKLQQSDKVFLKDGEKCWFVELNNIRMFESEGNYVRVYFDNNKPLILKSLNNLLERLDDKVFFRANRKYIINLNWVENIETWFNGGLIVYLKNGEKVEISRRQAAKFKEMMSL